jgi:hypothetical protein
MEIKINDISFKINMPSMKDVISAIEYKEKKFLFWKWKVKRDSFVSKFEGVREYILKNSEPKLDIANYPPPVAIKIAESVFNASILVKDQEGIDMGQESSDLEGGKVDYVW